MLRLSVANLAREIVSGIKQDGYATIEIGKLLCKKHLSLCEEFFMLQDQYKHACLISEESGFLGYIQANSGTQDSPEARSYVRPRGYSSFDFVNSPSVFSGCGTSVSNLWPSKNFEGRAKRCYNQLASISRALTRETIVQLGSAFFAGRLNQCDIERRNCSIMRLLRYPTISELEKSKEHSDYEFLSFVFCSDRGLQVFNGDEYEDVPFGETKATVLVGDAFEILSQRQITSTRHRAVALGRERRSVIFFQGLNYNFPMAIPEAVEMTFGQYLVAGLARSTPILKERYLRGEALQDLDIFRAGMTNN